MSVTGCCAAPVAAAACGAWWRASELWCGVCGSLLPVPVFGLGGSMVPTPVTRSEAVVGAGPGGRGSPPPGAADRVGLRGRL